MDHSLQQQFKSLVSSNPELKDRELECNPSYVRFELEHTTDSNFKLLLELYKRKATISNNSNSALIYILGLSDDYNPEARVTHTVSGSGPDIDTDFSPSGRDVIFKYLQDKYGYNNVAKISTYTPWNIKTSVVDFSRVVPLRKSNGDVFLDDNGEPIYPGYKQGEEIKKYIPDSFRGKKITWKDMKDDSSFTSLIARYKEVFEYSALVDDNPKNLSIHPCGILISPTPLSETIPIRSLSEKDFLLTQWEAPELEKHGFTKFDILAIDNLELNSRILKSIDKPLDYLDSIDYEDSSVFEMINLGSTQGLFQIEESHVFDVIKEAPVSSVFDIAAISALIRPGPKDAGLTADYIKWKQSGRLQNRIHKLLDSTLQETGGVLVYQEQIMEACNKLAGINLVLADDIRKAMGKKDQALMAKYSILFKDGCKNISNIPETEAQRIWDIIAGFAEYGFNKSHALAYAFLTYQNAYLKRYFPLHFMTALISLRADKPKVFKKYLHHAKQIGFKVKSPDINNSLLDFSYGEPETIFFGFNGIHGLGEIVSAKIIEAREQAGPFEDLWDFLLRVDRSKVNTKSVEILSKVGAFDCFGYDREDLVEFLPQVFDYLSKKESYESTLIRHEEREEEIKAWESEFKVWSDLNKKGQVLKLYDENNRVYYEPARPKKPVAIKLKDKPTIPDLSSTIRINNSRITNTMVYWEAEHCKCFISQHPLNFIENLSSIDFNYIEDIDEVHASSGKILAAVVSVTEVKIKHGKNKGKRMANLVVEDFTSDAELVLFQHQWCDYESAGIDGSPLIKPGDVIYFAYKSPEISGDVKRIKLASKIKVL